jgi:hypothetical protein
MKKVPVLTTAVLWLVVCLSAAAQGTGVELIRRPYQETPALPIAPYRSPQEIAVEAATKVAEAKKKIVAEKAAAHAASLVVPKWNVEVADGTIRSTLDKWVKRAGWTFPIENWSVDRDFPVMASAQFEGDFRRAVRNLLKTTELTDLQLQPCFYANNVLRVVARAELCDRMVAAGH